MEEFLKEEFYGYLSLTAARQRIQVGATISSTHIKAFLDKCVQGLLTERVNLFGNGDNYTLHCFRRGGAQHRFFESDRTWPLEMIKFWGG